VTHRSQARQKYSTACFGIPSVMSTRPRRQATHMFAGFASISIPHSQHMLDPHTTQSYSSHNNQLSEIVPILDVFGPPKFHRCRPPKWRTQILMAALRHVTWKNFVRLLPLAPVIGTYTLNFGPIFKFRSLKNVAGPPSPAVCALASLGHSLARVKM